jgi:hypothetical protein
MTRVMRTLGIWLFGLPASGLIGGLLGSLIDIAGGWGFNGTLGYGGFFGCFAGALSFGCLRLWLGEARARADGATDVAPEDGGQKRLEPRL